MLHRRVLALMTCVLWLLGVELLPDLHLASHRDDHSHGGAGEIVAHGHEHADAKPAKVSGGTQAAIDVPAGHAASGIAHHALAIHEPAPPLLAPIQVARAVVDQVHAPITNPRVTHVAAPSARGPPVR